MKDIKTNTLFFSNTLLDDEQYGWIKSCLLEQGVHFNGIPYTRDIWCRDYMPIQVDERDFVSFNYSPDYLVRKKGDKKFMTSLSDLQKWGYYWEGKNIRHCDLVLDGGNIVICGDKVILTEKVFRENLLKPYEITRRIERAFGKHAIWIPCDPHEGMECAMEGKIPLYHADGMLHAIDDNTILLANYKDYDISFRNELLARLLPYFKIKEFHFDSARTENSWIYINYLQVQDIVLVPVLGGDDAGADRMAIEQLKNFLGTDNVFGINTKKLTFNGENGGGALHCISWNVYDPSPIKTIKTVK